MELNYLHPEKRNKEELYSFRLISWLIKKGIIPKKKETKILDLGSGKGYFYSSLIKLGYSNVSAVDLDPKFKECIQGDVTKGLSFKKESFEVIISRDVVEHILKSEEFFNEQHRIIEKAGRIIVMTPNAKHMSLGRFYEDYTHVRPFTTKSLGEALIMHNFRNVKVKKLRAIPFFWRYSIKAFDYVFSPLKNNLLGIAMKDKL